MIAVAIYPMPICNPCKWTVIKKKSPSGKTFWALDDYLAWLNGENISFAQVDKNGATLPAIEVRTHVAIDGETGTSQDGLLFQTAAYDFANPKRPPHRLARHTNGLCDCQRMRVAKGQ